MSLAFVAALLPVRGWIAVGVTAVTVGFAGYKIGYFIGEEVGHSDGYEQGEKTEREKWEIEQARLNKMIANEVASATIRYVAEVERSTELQNRLAVTKKQAAVLRKERDEAIKKYVTGTQRCLSADAVRVLNSGPADAGSMSASTASAAPGSAGGTAAGTAASDRDVAEWISDARERYSTCAAQVNSWVEWYKGIHR